MSKFKGTKGKWEFDDECVLCLSNGMKSIDIVVNNPKPYQDNNDKWDYNALLISKAPEMLKMLEKLAPLLKQRHLYETANKVELLIKEATDL